MKKLNVPALFLKRKLMPLSTNKFLKRINQSIKDSENGKLTAHYKLIFQIRKWI
jgi:hypothetical protein